MYWVGVPPPPKLAASRGYPDSSDRPLARTSLSLSAIASSASSQEIGTKPGSCRRPFCGLVRRIGWRIRCGL
jgi:hypothetical protein